MRRDEDEDPRGVGRRCYCGIPERGYNSDGTPDRKLIEVAEDAEVDAELCLA